MRRSVRRAVTIAVLAVAGVAGGGVAVGSAPPDLRSTGPTTVAGTEASAVFEVGTRTIRQVRYDDAGTLHYGFRVRNDGRLPVTVRLADDQPPSRLFTATALAAPEALADDAAVQVPAGGVAEVVLDLTMNGCESLSARAGSFVTHVALDATRLGTFDDRVLLALPEELHTGSPREAFCPESTATSRPPG